MATAASLVRLARLIIRRCPLHSRSLFHCAESSRGQRAAAKRPRAERSGRRSRVRQCHSAEPSLAAEWWRAKRQTEDGQLSRSWLSDSGRLTAGLAPAAGSVALTSFPNRVSNSAVHQHPLVWFLQTRVHSHDGRSLFRSRGRRRCCSCRSRSSWRSIACH